jgi:hypothetical protein
MAPEHAFHGQGLTDHSARVLRELRPVGSELELHGDPGDDTDREVDSEDAAPEARGPGIALAFAAKGLPSPEHQEGRETHGELGKQVVIRNGERELQPMPERRVVHERGS